MTAPAIVTVRRDIGAPCERLFDAWASYADPVRNGWTTILDTFERQMETTHG